MGKCGAASVDVQHSIAIIEALHVGMAADHDLRLHTIDQEVLPLRVVDHGDSLTLDIKDLHLLDARVYDSEVVVASRGQNGRDLLQPVKDDGVNDVSSV